MSRRSATTTKVFVGNLPANATTKDLRELFTPYGAIAECDIAIRCGFLHLEDQDMAMKAIEELNNTTFMGVRISVEKGRVKPPGRRGRGGFAAGPIRGGEKDRNGPYSRDNLGRPPRIGSYGSMREYPMYADHYGYDRSGRYDEYIDRRYMYDERRMTDPYGRTYPNGYTYDERAYMDMTSGVYDDRRMVYPSAAVYDERYATMGMERRTAMDQSVTQTKPVQTTYDRTQADMYSRRDTVSKPLDRSVPSYSTATTAYAVSSTPAYGVTSAPVYGQTAAGWGAYGDSRATAAMGYESTAAVQPGAYGDSRATASQGYDTRAATSQVAAPMYTDTRSAAVASTTPYSTATATNYTTPASYTTVQFTGYETVAAVRTGTYDATYPPLPQQRSYASAGGPAPRRDMPPPGPGRRY